MASEVSTIQSLKAVDAWIDVINSNINGGVRTAYKASRLKFSGSNVDVSRTGNATSLPLQFPEPALTTANTVIDFSQGAITTSTENTHLAIQGDGFFLIASPDAMNPVTGLTSWSPSAKFLLTRDGEFRTNSAGFLVNSAGYYLVTVDLTGGTTGVPIYSSVAIAGAASTRAIFNDIDMPNGPAPPNCVRLTDFLTQNITTDFANTGVFGPSALVNVPRGQQSLRYSTYGSTVFDFGFQTNGAALSTMDPNLILQDGTTADATVLNKSLEASNASMTQSVPELSLAQKLFSALTKVLQTKQTNVDGVLNLVR
jgi:flagellar hook-basal body protein